TSWLLSKKEGDERWVTPVVVDGKVAFRIGGPGGDPPKPSKLGRGASFECVACGSLLIEDYLRAEGEAGRIGLRLTAAIDSSANDSRIYRSPTEGEEAFALSVTAPDDAP